MKKVILTLTLILVLISFTSAMEFDNVKNVKELGTANYPNIEIKNTFGLGKVLWQGELIRNTNNCGIYCEAEQKIILNEKGSLIDDVIFETILENGDRVKQQIRSYQFYIKTGGTQIEVDDYETQCVNGKYIEENKTYEQICNQVKIGSHLEDAPQWTSYNLGSEVESGTYVLKLVGEKKPSRTVDWVIKTKGKWLDEWAIWGKLSLSEGLVAQYNMNDNTTSTKVIDYLGKNNGTLINGGNTIDASVSGKLSNAIDFNGTNAYIDIGKPIDMNFTGYPNVSFFGWVKYNQLVNFAGIIDNSIGAGTTDVRFSLHYNANRLRLVIGNGTTIEAKQSNQDIINIGEWYFVGFVLNASNIQFYINGNTSGSEQTFTQNVASSSSSWKIGRGFNNTNYDMNGSVDNFRIYNKSLNTNEISYLYNSGLGIESTSNAEVILNSPADSSIALINLITFNATANVIGGATLINMSLWTNESGSWEKNKTINISGELINAHGVTLGTSGLVSSKDGLKLLALENTTLRSITIYNGGTKPTTAYLWDYDENVLETATIGSDNKANFTHALVQGTQYFVVVDKGGADWTRYYSADLGYVIAGTSVNFTSGYQGGDDNKNHPRLFAIVEVTTNRLLNNYNYNFSKSINKTLLWNIESCDSDGDCGFALSNRTLFIDTSQPSFSIENPNNTLIYNKVGNNETLNSTITDINLQSCWYNYNGTNVSIEGCQSGIKNSTNFILENNNFNMTIYANDSVGNINSTLISWDYNILEIGQFYEDLVYETQITNFNINLTYNSSNQLSVLLNYDNINYSTINFGTGSNGIFSSDNFNIPLINSSSNKTFYWILNYSNNLILTPATNQSINNLIISNCNSNYTTIALNFTFYNELNQSILNPASNPTSILVNFNYWIGDSSIKKNYAYQALNSSNNTFHFCLSPNITLMMDMDMQYYATDYVERTYYFRNESINNVTQNIKLYNLLIDEGTKFSVIVKEGTAVFETAIVKIWKYFVGLGEYKIIMIGLTDNKGEFTANLDLDQSYNFSVIKYNTDYGGFLKQTSCSASPCEINLNVEELALSGFSELDNYFAQNVIYNLTYNQTNKIISLNFTDLLGTAQYWRLYVYQNNYENDSIISICDLKTYSVNGNLSCNYSLYSGEINAKVYISRSPERLATILSFVNENTTEILGISALIASIIIILVIVFTGTRNPAIALLLLPFALVILKLIKFLPLDWKWIFAFAIFIVWIIGKMNT